VKNSRYGITSQLIPLTLLLAIATSLSACATRPPADDLFAVAAYEEANDPLEPLNRTLFKTDQVLDTVLVRPILTGYRAVVPDRGRKSVNNFMNHIRSPITLVHDVLQGDMNRAGTTLGRIAVNSTLGFFGLFDVGEQIGLPYHTEDLGQTMAVWGADEGPYVYVPLLGPSNFRDGFGFLVDAFLIDPLGWYLANPRNNVTWAQWSRFGLLLVTTKDSTMDATDELQASSLDYYSALRSAYRQIRADEIRNGAPVPLEDFDDFDDMSAIIPFLSGSTASVLTKTPDTFISSN
jgi:phospholipid-binding lipoprotein MlaA